ncbi:GNAT family N-acetyltransferase [Branchiibius hedensis]|uniref:GNAT family N-acetyltransferase n=1 Tax=Branchiibius hedensis TaxID=672460 RepID=UPI00147558C1|nr:GNAT family N-acetyltransferase [Branchiibius hedensis]
MTCLIEELDVSSDAAIEAFHTARNRAEEQDFAFHTSYSLPETIAMLRSSQHAARRVLRQARIGDAVVGVGAAMLPLLDNTATADVGIAVVPEARRQGVGRALLESLLSESRAADRTRAIAWLQWPYDGGRDGSTSPGMQFAAATGFHVSQLEVQRVLDLPVPIDVLDTLTAQAATHHAGYTFRTWTGAAPQEILPGYGRLIGAVETEAPTGEHVPEVEVWDEQRIREQEAELEQQGRTRITTLAVAPDGEPVGYTDLVHAATDGGRVYQWGTLVDRDHRGHRLGTALKVRTARAMQEAFPDAPYVRTWNAESNAPMIAVNDAMGFRPVGWAAELYRDL